MIHLPMESLAETPWQKVYDWEKNWSVCIKSEQMLKVEGSEVVVKRCEKHNPTRVVRLSGGR